MANRPAAIRQTEVTRLLKGILASGFQIAKVEVEGAKLIIFGRDAAIIESTSPLEQWRRENGES